MSEKVPEKRKEGEKRRRRRKQVSNLEPAEELVKGPTGEEIYRV